MCALSGDEAYILKPPKPLTPDFVRGFLSDKEELLAFVDKTFIKGAINWLYNESCG